MTIENYVKAGKIAAEVREMVRVKDWIGKTVYEICEEVKMKLKKEEPSVHFQLMPVLMKLQHIIQQNQMIQLQSKIQI